MGRDEYNQLPGCPNTFVGVLMPKVTEFYSSLQQLTAEMKLFLISFKAPKRNHLSLPSKKDFHKARPMAHTCDPHTSEVEAGGWLRT